MCEAEASRERQGCICPLFSSLSLGVLMRPSSTVPRSDVSFPSRLTLLQVTDGRLLPVPHAGPVNGLQSLRPSVIPFATRERVEGSGGEGRREEEEGGGGTMC